MWDVACKLHGYEYAIYIQSLYIGIMCIICEVSRSGITTKFPRCLMNLSKVMTFCLQASCYQLNHGAFTRYVKLRVAHAPGIPGTFSPPPRVSDPDLHHGTCVIHMQSWCMTESLISDFLWSRWLEKMFPASPAHRQLAILRIWQGVHAAKWFSWRSMRPYSGDFIVHQYHLGIHIYVLNCQFIFFCSQNDAVPNRKHTYFYGIFK